MEQDTVLCAVCCMPIAVILLADRLRKLSVTPFSLRVDDSAIATGRQLAHSWTQKCEPSSCSANGLFGSVVSRRKHAAVRPLSHRLFRRRSSTHRRAPPPRFAPQHCIRSRITSRSGWLRVLANTCAWAESVVRVVGQVGSSRTLRIGIAYIEVWVRKEGASIVVACWHDKQSFRFELLQPASTWKLPLSDSFSRASGSHHANHVASLSRSKSRHHSP